MSFISCERGSKANFRWKQKNKDKNGEQVNREHKTTNFRWGGGGGAGEHTPLFQGNMGTPLLLEVLANVSSAKHIKA